MKKRIPLQHLTWLKRSQPTYGDVKGISARAILLGAVLAFLLNLLDAYATTLIRGSYLTLNFSTPAALFFFFFVVLASALVACLRRPLALDQAELVTIYIMLAVACCVPGMGFTQFIIPLSLVPLTMPRPRTTGISSTTNTSPAG